MERLTKLHCKGKRYLISIAFLFIALWHGVTFADNLFVTPDTYSVGLMPNFVAVGDFNGDGRPDIVTANGDTTISVLLNNSNGTFVPSVTYSVGNILTSIAVGDFNRDGKPDIVTGSNVSTTISVLLNNGNGTFAPPVVYSVGTSPTSVAVGDFNGDGRLDIVTAHKFNNAISVLLNNGNGTFAPPVVYSVGTSPTSVAVGDFNGDGKPDIVTSNFDDNTISVLLNNGNGTFAPTVPYPIGIGFFDNNWPTSVAVGDFNGDGKPDIVTSNFGDNTISVLLNNGDGTFAPPVTYSVESNASVVAVGDFNGDGKIDIVTANNLRDNTISVLLNNGDGTFALAVTYSVGNKPVSVAVGDFNGDGKPDIVTANNNDNTISVLLNRGSGTFASAVSYIVGTGPNSVAMGDFNGDGMLDIVTAVCNNYDYKNFICISSSVVNVLLNNGNGTFARTAFYSVGKGPYSVAVGDLNGDGKPELVTGNFDDDTISVLMNNGDGTFAPAATYYAGITPNSVTVEDFNGDGKPDIVTANQFDITISVLMNNGDGTFAPAATYYAGIIPNSLAVGDFNGDGKPDIVTANVFYNAISVLLNNGNGTFARTAFYSVGKGPYSVAVGDFNGDGKPDIVTSNFNDHTISVLMNNGDGTFAPAVAYSVGTSPTSVAVGDFNGDGKPDIVTGNDFSKISVLLNNGNGAFAPAVAYSVGTSPTSVAVGDFNGDGKPDIITANNYSDGLSIKIGTITVLQTISLSSQCTLTVASSDPISGVNIVASPSDISGQSNGTSPFTRTYNNGTPVTLVAPPTAGGNSFSGWNSCDSTSGTQCDVIMNQSRSVTATYTVNPTQYTLIITKSGTGDGNVTANTGTINWSGNSGTATYNNTSVILTAVALNGSTFTSWSGCDSTNGNQCNVIVNQSKSVTATFTVNLTQYTLIITKSGTGNGNVTANTGTINWSGNSGTATYNNTSVTLTAVALNGSTFTSWSGCDSTNGNQCTVMVNNDRSVNAMFTAVQAGNPKTSTKPTSLNFGSLKAGSTSNPKTITVKNTGKGSLMVDSVTITGTNADEFGQTNSCTVISPGESCTISVTFSPIPPFGKKSAIITISSNDHRKPTINVKLSGQASPPKISVSPMTVKFGFIQTGTTFIAKEVTIKNTGISDLVINVITISGADALEFSQTNYCTTIAKASSCDITVTLSPTSVGNKNATISISSNDPRKPSLIVKLTGKGT